jgi:hypothetical protein
MSCPPLLFICRLPVMPCLYCASVGGCPIGWEGKGREGKSMRENLKGGGERKGGRLKFVIC